MYIYIYIYRERERGAERRNITYMIPIMSCRYPCNDISNDDINDNDAKSNDANDTGVCEKALLLRRGPWGKSP